MSDCVWTYLLFNVVQVATPSKQKLELELACLEATWKTTSCHIMPYPSISFLVWYPQDVSNLFYFAGIFPYFPYFSKLGACTIFVAANQHLQNIAEPHEIVQECVFAFFGMLLQDEPNQCQVAQASHWADAFFPFFLCNSMHACAHIWSYMCTYVHWWR